jgi:hypothetical protein
MIKFLLKCWQTYLVVTSILLIIALIHFSFTNQNVVNKKTKIETKDFEEIIKYQNERPDTLTNWDETWKSNITPIEEKNGN